MLLFYDGFPSLSGRALWIIGNDYELLYQPLLSVCFLCPVSVGSRSMELSSPEVKRGRAQSSSGWGKGGGTKKEGLVERNRHFGRFGLLSRAWMNEVMMSWVSVCCTLEYWMSWMTMG